VLLRTLGLLGIKTCEPTEELGGWLQIQQTKLNLTPITITAYAEKRVNSSHIYQHPHTADGVVNSTYARQLKIISIKAGLVLRQGYIPEKVAQIEQIISHLKQCISCGLGD
jgi:hypothetical protein